MFLHLALKSMPHPMPQPIPNASTNGAVQPIRSGTHAAENHPFSAILGIRGILQEAWDVWESRAHPTPWLIALQPATADLGSLQ